MNLSELAAILHLEAKGPGDYRIDGVRDIEMLAPGVGLEEGFVYIIESPAVAKRHPEAAERGVILTSPALADRFPRALVAPEGGVRLALIALLKHFDKTPAFPPGVDREAWVHPSARVAASASVLPGVSVMEGAAIGERCILYPGVVVEPFASVGDGTVLFPAVVVGHHCSIGRDCIVHGGTVIGADGFGFHDDASGRHKIPQIGNVAIADHVEIGASCTVDRATIETTSIGEHTKLDDQVHIGHNCRVGRYIYIVGNTAIGGSVVIEDGAMLSGMVIVKDHVRIAAGSKIMGLSGVAQDTEPKAAYFGAPARPAREMHKMHAALERLPELLAKVRLLERKVESLEIRPAAALPEPARGTPKPASARLAPRPSAAAGGKHPAASTVFVGNLPWDMTETRLREVFEACGAVASVKLIVDKATGRSKGFAFVEMSGESAARLALEKLNDAAVGERRIFVNPARPLEPRPAAGFGDPKPRFGAGKPSFGTRKPRFGAGKPSFGDRKPRFGGRKPGRYARETRIER